ncbi:hypothetical protein ACFYXF_31570 [Streptomyces sp. NPDC002680]|uniref:hypothetical protein n=1 Tax=Streptomyces sp. NPDC002680 TaxID=3364659 RepID=UPI0036B88E8E
MKADAPDCGLLLREQSVDGLDDVAHVLAAGVANPVVSGSGSPHLSEPGESPEQTAEVARPAFPKGCLCSPMAVESNPARARTTTTVAGARIAVRL